MQELCDRNQNQYSLYCMWLFFSFLWAHFLSPSFLLSFLYVVVLFHSLFFLFLIWCCSFLPLLELFPSFLSSLSITASFFLSSVLSLLLLYFPLYFLFPLFTLIIHSFLCLCYSFPPFVSPLILYFLSSSLLSRSNNEFFFIFSFIFLSLIHT